MRSSKVVAVAGISVVCSVLVPLQARAAWFSTPPPANGAGAILLARSSHSDDQSTSTHHRDDQASHHSAREYLADPHALRRERKLAGTTGTGGSPSGSSQMRDLRMGLPQSAPKSREGDSDK